MNGQKPVKGMPEPVEVFALEGATGALTRLEASPPADLTRFVGRQEELEAISKLLAGPDVRWVTLSGSGALQLLPAVLGVCMPSRRIKTAAGVLSGIGVGLATLYATLFGVTLGPLGIPPNPLGLHHSVWALAANFLTVLVVSRVTAPPSDETVERIHGEVERFWYAKDDEPSPPPAASMAAAA